MNFPIERVRADFPLLSRQVNGQPLVYLDSAASAQNLRRSLTRSFIFTVMVMRPFIGAFTV